MNDCNHMSMDVSDDNPEYDIFYGVGNDDINDIDENELEVIEEDNDNQWSDVDEDEDNEIKDNENNENNENIKDNFTNKKIDLLKYKSLLNINTNIDKNSKKS